jgi:hypothetical protein
MSIANNAGTPPAAPHEDTPPVIHDLDEVNFDDDGNVIPAGSQTTTTQDDPNGQPPATAGAATADSPATVDDLPQAQSAGELLLNRLLGTTEIQYGEVEEARQFSTLTPEEQADVIEQLLSAGTPTDAPEGGLSPEALQFDQLIKSGMTPEQALEQLSGSIGQLGEDELNVRDIREQYPTFTEEQVQAELEDRKAGRNYHAKTEALRAKFQASQPNLEQLTAQQQEAMTAQLEAERAEIVRTVQELPNVDGFQVSDEIKNHLLAKMVELEENQLSPAVNQLDNPANMFKALYYLEFMPQIVQHYHSEIQAAEERGYKRAVEGFPNRPVTADAGAPQGSAGKPAAQAQPRRDDPNYDPLMEIDSIG